MDCGMWTIDWNELWTEVDCGQELQDSGLECTIAVKVYWIEL